MTASGPHARLAVRYGASLGKNVTISSADDPSPFRARIDAVAAPEHDADAPTFLRGGGALGALIRAHDWTTTPLGPPAHWPQSLRLVVRLMLDTHHPMFVFWGPDSICLYNDGYSASLGPELHPAMLGVAGATAWADIWPVIGPQIQQVMAGQGATWHQDHLIPIQRHGRREEVYWTYSYSPIDDDTAPGGIGGVLVICTETTARVQAEQRQAFVVALVDALRDARDPAAVLAIASAMLGERLGVDSVGFIDADLATDMMTIKHEWHSANGPTVAGRHRVIHFGPALTQELRSGQIVVVGDVAHEERIVAPVRTGLVAAGVSAFVVVPLWRDHALRSLMFVVAAKPRRWNDLEVGLIADVAERTVAARTSARAHRALADNERLLRAIGESSGELIFAKDRDHRMLYANSATLAVIGKPAEVVLGRSEAEWHDDPAEAAVIMANDRAVMDGGETMPVEEHFTTAEGEVRIFQGTKAPMRDGDGAIVGVVGVTRDVTDHSNAQRRLRLMIDELNHRVKNTLAIVQGIAYQTFRQEGIAIEARSAFDQRLAALGKAHGLLTRESWESADLAAVAAEACAPHLDGADRITMNGPSLRLAPKTAVTIAMALHELCTNAAKYGALSVDSGRVALTWSIECGAHHRLHLRWQESGGPPVVAPNRRGFGSMMIERALSTELQGDVRLDFLPEGLLCTIDAPLPDPNIA